MIQPKLQAAVSRQLAFRSPAKVNVFFRVKHKREDGYHEIHSLYQAITLSDTLHVAVAEEDCFTCSNPLLVMDGTNLVLQALALFRTETGCKQPLKIHLEKKIPMQAGLGGGSSNAATLLFACKELLKMDISEEMLAAWGSQIGSDVSFFFSEGSALASGRGEVLEAAFPHIKSRFWIVKPPEGLSTQKVYGALNCQKLPLRKSTDNLYNDLEIPAFALDPSLAKLKEALLCFGFSHVLLCGSGTSFFCLEGNRKYTQAEIEKEFPRLQVFSVSPLQRKQGTWYE